MPARMMNIMKKHVQEVLQLQPPRKAGIDRGRGLCDPRDTP